MDQRKQCQLVQLYARIQHSRIRIHICGVAHVNQRFASPHDSQDLPGMDHIHTVFESNSDNIIL